MVHSIAFLENKEQLDALLKTVGNDRQHVHCVAVFPEQYEQALQENLSVQPLDDFGHVGSLAAYNSATISRIERLTGIFDPLWDALTKDIDCARCVSFRAFFHSLKGYYDALVKRAIPVSRALDHLCPEFVWLLPMRYEISKFSILDRPSRGLTSLLVPLMAANKTIPTNSTMLDGVQNGFFFLKNDPVSVPFATALSRLVHGERRDGLVQDQHIFHNVLLTYPSILNEMENSFTHSLFKEDIQTMHASPSDTSTALPLPVRIQFCRAIADKVTDEFFATPSVPDQMRIDDIDFSPVLKPYMNALLRHKLAELLSLSYIACPFYKRFKKSVLLSGGMNLESFVLTRAARRAGVRTINQHKGGMLGYAAIPTLERYDLAEAEYYFVNGKGAVQNYAHPCEGALWPEGYPRAKQVPVGAPWAWNIYRKSSRQKQDSGNELKICYILESDIGDHAYLGGLARPAFSHYAAEKAVVDVFSRHPNIKLCIKSYPKKNFIQDIDQILNYLKELQASNITVLEPCSIASIADSFDVFILDYPGTPLAELAASGKTLVLYIDEESYALHENAQQILTECAHYFKKSAPFLKFLEDFCNNTTLLTQKSMQPFLSAFVLPSLEQSPSTTIQKFVTRLIRS